MRFATWHSIESIPWCGGVGEDRRLLVSPKTNGNRYETICTPAEVVDERKKVEVSAKLGAYGPRVRVVSTKTLTDRLQSEQSHARGVGSESKKQLELLDKQRKSQSAPL